MEVQNDKPSVSKKYKYVHVVLINIYLNDFTSRSFEDMLRHQNIASDHTTLTCTDYTT